VKKPIADASAREYEGLILPGGTVNADRLRLDDHVISFVKEYFRPTSPLGPSATALGHRSKPTL
jgi:protease I